MVLLIAPRKGVKSAKSLRGRPSVLAVLAISLAPREFVMISVQSYSTLVAALFQRQKQLRDRLMRHLREGQGRSR